MHKDVVKAMRHDSHKYMWGSYILYALREIFSLVLPTIIAWLVGGYDQFPAFIGQGGYTTEIGAFSFSNYSGSICFKNGRFIYGYGNYPGDC